MVEPILDHAIFDQRDYLVEGVNLRPETIAHFIAETDRPARACFLGYPDTRIDDKVAAVGSHTGPPTDWLNRTGTENTRRYLTVSRELSRQFRETCARLDIPFIDTGADFRAGIDAAEAILTLPA